ncbi:hypothetical protein [Bradyrhizobium canariense]|uniref:hypothetical protein n=1 Tax=Bradyrhizobium canariense TaxID=255045 RepID=UPI001B89E3D2|nr:hypothetical protein [Bradyrhizobium canariense]MBR0950636.1 hypothetical protein [Bradyrhizobium canariense]
MIFENFIVPLFYAIPLGLGILLLWCWRSWLPTMVLPAAFLLGAVVIARTFEIAERWYVLDHIYGALVGAIILLSTLGLLLGLASLRGFRLPRAPLILGALVATPAYLYVFFWLSSFPFTDLFADIHSMKIAVELARSHVLNNIDGASYIQVKPILSSILISAFGHDPLAGAWAIAPWTAAFKVLVAWQASQLVDRAGNRMLAFALLSSTLLGFELGNGTLCTFGSIVLLVALGDFGAKIENSRTAVGSILVLSTGALLFWRALNPYALPSVAILVGIPVFAAIVGASTRASAEKSIWLFALLIFVLIGCLVPLHRVSALYILIAAAAAATWRLRDWPWLVTTMAWMGRASTLAAGIIPLLALGIWILGTNSSLSLDDAFFKITKLFGGSVGAELLLGLGVKNAVIEWGAATGALFAMLVSVVFLYSILSPDGRALWKEPLFALYWTLAAGLTCFILTGFPFAYRAMPFVCVFFALALSTALPRLWIRVGEPYRVAAVLPALFGLAYAAVMTLPPLATYLRFYIPLAAGLVLAGIATLIAARRPAWRAGSLVALLAFTLMADRLSARAILFPHSYGKPTNTISAITHYSADEIELANYMRKLPLGTIIVSDPFTTSIIRARTGLNSPYPYSNLDTLNESSERSLRIVLRAASSGDRDDFCHALAEMLPSATEYAYLVNRMHQEVHTVAAVIVYSSRTKAWQDSAQGQRGSYFPATAALDEPTVRRIEQLAEGEVHWSGEIALARLSCAPEG